MKFGIAKERAHFELASPSTLLALSCSLLANAGCNDDNANNNGVGGAAYGGSYSTMGGQTSRGGTSPSTGGTRLTGGAGTVSGGNSAIAGATSIPTAGAGGTTAGVGGTTTTGGTSGSSVLAGATSTGGIAATGGKSASGGTSAGAGTSTTGGTTSAAGTSTTGGTTSAAGTSTTGGTTSVAGTSAVGGASTAGRASTVAGAAGAAGETSTALRNVVLDMTGMTPNVNQMMQFRLVRTTSNLLSFVGILDGLPSAAYGFTMPNSAINEAYRLDFFADVNANRMYDAPPTDNAWRQAVPAGLADTTLTFARSANFTDISTPTFTPLGADFAFQATGMVPHVGQLFELRVLDPSTGRVVGKYVLPAIGAATFSITIPMIIKDLTNYQIDLFADYNGNGRYDPPPADHAWRLSGVGSPAGLTVTFAHNTTFTDVGF